MKVHDLGAAVEQALDDIEEDILDRRGLKWEWRAIDAEVRVDIKRKWLALISKRLEEALRKPGT